MASLVQHIPRTTAKTTASMGNLAEIDPSSSTSSLSSRHQNVATPTSMYGSNTSIRNGMIRPQISVENVDSANLSVSNSDSVDTASHSNSTTSVTSVKGKNHSPFPVHQKSSSSNPASPIHQDEASAEAGGIQNATHLQVVSRTKKKSFTLPLSLTLTGYSDSDVQSRDSSAPNSSDYVLSENEGSGNLDPRHFIYWGGWKGEGEEEADLKSDDKLFLRNVRAMKIRSNSELYSNDYDVDLSGSDASFGNDRRSSDLVILPSRVAHDDNVFHEVFGNPDHEADSKLVDWSLNVFVPACRTLLHHCATEGTTELAEAQILADMRSLSNTINFFCTEQQRLNGQLRRSLRSGMKSSVSTDRLMRIKDIVATVNDQRDCNASYKNSTLTDSASGCGFERREGHCDRSYAVKILRSVSQSLIAPLLHEYEDGFNLDLYKSIVQAIQKIAWKVEACLSFNEPSNNIDIYGKIFEDLKEGLTEMMIRALPPEEPKLKIPAFRSSSMSTSKRRGSIGGGRGGCQGGDEVSPYLDTAISSSSSCVLRRAPNSLSLSGRLDSGSVSSTAIGSDARTTTISSTGSLSPSADTTGVACVSEHLSCSDLDFAGDLLTDMDSIIRRRRMATYDSPARRRRAWHGVDLVDEADIESCRLSQEITECSLLTPHYFTPKHTRRTTVSLSRREVSQLGWRVAKMVDKFAASRIEEASSVTELSVEEVVVHSDGEEEEVHEVRRGSEDGAGRREREVLAKRLQANLCTKFEGEEIVMRAKSASTSDLHVLDCSPNSKGVSRSRMFQKTSQRMCNLSRGYALLSDYDNDEDDVEDDDSVSCVSLQNQSLLESTSVNDHLRKSYTPMKKQHSSPASSGEISDDWTYVVDPFASVDSSRLRSASKNSKLRGSGLVNKTGNKAKKAVEKSLSASEKFTNRVIKTAYALRRGTISTFAKTKKPGTIMDGSSIHQVKEDAMQSELMGPRLTSSVNGRPTTTPPKYVTMPTKNLKGTLSRLGRKSFSISGSLPRTKKKIQHQRSGFLMSPMSGDNCYTSVLTDSIYRFSKNAVQPSMEDSELIIVHRG